MDQWERELHIARIVAGKTRIATRGAVYYLVSPGREERLNAAEIFRQARQDASMDGALREFELLIILERHGVWTEKDEVARKTLEKGLEDLKVGLFEKRFQSNAKTSIRAALKKTRDEMARMDGIRYGLEQVTVDGVASVARQRYLISSCLRDSDGNRFRPDEGLIDNCIEILSYDRLNEAQFRELARTDPWRPIWSAKAHAGRGVFDLPAVELSEDQKNLVIWSNIYDNIREYPDCPADDIIEDDDMLDGWMIIHRCKREAEAASQGGASGIGNDKIRNSGEVFMMADTIEDAREIEKMNDEFASNIKAGRMSFLKQQGEVNEVQMPDTKQRIAMEFNRLEQLKMRQAKG
jgi:hypothetical protein